MTSLSMTGLLWASFLVPLIGGALLLTQHKSENIRAVSYTHLTLPTTPYV